MTQKSFKRFRVWIAGDRTDEAFVFASGYTRDEAAKDGAIMLQDWSDPLFEMIVFVEPDTGGEITRHAARFSDAEIGEKMIDDHSRDPDMFAESQLNP